MHRQRHFPFPCSMIHEQCLHLWKTTTELWAKKIFLYPVIFHYVYEKIDYVILVLCMSTNPNCSICSRGLGLFFSQLDWIKVYAQALVTWHLYKPHIHISAVVLVPTSSWLEPAKFVGSTLEVNHEENTVFAVHGCEPSTLLNNLQQLLDC